MQRRREMLMMDTGGLPRMYQKIEYIRGRNRKAYIDTGVEGIGNDSLVIRGKCEVESYRIYLDIFGAYTSESANTTRLIFANAEDYLYGMVNMRAGSSTRLRFSASLINRPFIYTLSKKRLIIDDEVKTYTANQQGTIVASHLALNTTKIPPSDVSNYVYEKHYYFQILDGSTLVRDYIPCKCLENGKVGLYDLVTRSFKTSDGTEEFEEPMS